MVLTTFEYRIFPRSVPLTEVLNTFAPTCLRFTENYQSSRIICRFQAMSNERKSG
jgi:hypothetical protein